MAFLSDSSHETSLVWLYTCFVVGAFAAFLIVSIVVGFSLSLFLFAFIAASFFVIRVPEAGLLSTILLTMVFERFFTLQPFVWGDHAYKLYPLDILMVMTGGALLLHLVFHKRRLVLTVVDIPFFLFVSVVVGVFLGGVVLGHGDAALNVSAVKNYAFYALFYVLTIGIATDRHAWKRIVGAFCIGGVAILFFIIVGLVRGYGVWTEYTPLSTEGRRLLASTHAYYVTIPFLILLLRFAWQTVSNRVVEGTVWILQGVGIVGSLMRHLWIALAVTAVVVWATLAHAPRRILHAYARMMALVATLVVLGVLLVALVSPTSRIASFLPHLTSPLLDRITSLVRGTEDLSTAWRVDVWKASLESFQKYPVFGIGFGRNMTFLRENYLLTIDVREIHNSPLAILVQTGLAGFLPFLFFLILLARQWHRVRQRIEHTETPFIYAIGGSAFLFFIASFFQPYLETNMTGIFFWILLGLIRTAPTQTENFKSQITNYK